MTRCLLSNLTDFTVAATRFARDGLVAEFLAGGSKKFFNCPFWSDFADEDEKLFLGGLIDFTFGSIRNIKTQQNYGVYVQAISMFQLMIRGSTWNSTITSITKTHCFAINQLIKEEIAQKVVKGESSLIPDYILCLWHNLLVNIEHIELNWNLMDFEQFASKRRLHKCGYKSFGSWFCNEDMTAPAFGAILQLLPNLEVMSVYQDVGFAKSFAMKPEIISNLLECLKMHCSVRQIDIVNPKVEIKHFVARNKEQFKEIGWRISKKTFRCAFRPQPHVCKSNLLIERI